MQCHASGEGLKYDRVMNAPAKHKVIELPSDFTLMSSYDDVIAES